MRIAFVVLALSLSILSSCSSDDSIVGSDTVVTQTRTATGFTSIENEGSINVFVEYASTFSVVVEANDNIVDHVKTDVVNGVLKIDMQDGSYSNLRIVVRVRMPEIGRVSNDGSGDISFTSAFNTDNLDVVVHGSGDVAFSDLTTESLTTEQVGSGNITIEGSATSHNSNIRGSGNLHGFNFNTVETAVVIYGSGNANVKVRDRLFADIFGSGNITYDGTPAIDQHITGSGRVFKR